MADARKVFVTVGTTSFDRLIETVSSKAFLEVPKIAIIEYAAATFFCADDREICLATYDTNLHIELAVLYLKRETPIMDRRLA